MDGSELGNRDGNSDGNNDGVDEREIEGIKLGVNDGT